MLSEALAARIHSVKPFTALIMENSLQSNDTRTLLEKPLRLYRDFETGWLWADAGDDWCWVPERWLADFPEAVATALLRWYWTHEAVATALQSPAMLSLLQRRWLVPRLVCRGTERL